MGAWKVTALGGALLLSLPVMGGRVEFSLKELHADSLVRPFPGMEEMEIRYNRCPAT